MKAARRRVAELHADGRHLVARRGGFRVSLEAPALADRGHRVVQDNHPVDEAQHRDAPEQVPPVVDGGAGLPQPKIRAGMR